MTHDELLQKIDDEISNGLGLMAVATLGEGLKAVLNLHRPWVNGQMYCQVCVGQSYPCDTIQAITKGMES